MDRLTPRERELIQKGIEAESTLSGYELESKAIACNNWTLSDSWDINKAPQFLQMKKELEKTLSPNEEKVKKGLEDLKNDPFVFHPDHYIRDGIEVASVIRAFKLDFFTGNAIKYILRSQYKGNEIQDLKKAIFNLQLKVTDLENAKIRESEDKTHQEKS